MAYRRLHTEYDMFYEPDQPSRWMDAREAAKMIAWNRQELIANELSRLVHDEYLEDIMQHLREMEVRDTVTRADWHRDISGYLEANRSRLSRTRHDLMQTSSTCSVKSNGSCDRT
jgi:hypothetical protein